MDTSQTSPSYSAIEVLAFQRNAYSFPGLTLLPSGDSCVVGYSICQKLVLYLGGWHRGRNVGVNEGY